MPQARAANLFAPFVTRLSDRLWLAVPPDITAPSRGPVSLPVLNSDGTVQVVWPCGLPTGAANDPATLMLIIRPAAAARALGDWFGVLTIADNEAPASRFAAFTLSAPVLVYVDAPEPVPSSQVTKWAAAAGVADLLLDGEDTAPGGCLLLSARTARTWTGPPLGSSASVLAAVAADRPIAGRVDYDDACPLLRLMLPIGDDRLPGPLTATGFGITVPLMAGADLSAVALTGMLACSETVQVALRADIPLDGGPLVGRTVLEPSIASGLLDSRLPTPTAEVLLEAEIDVQEHGVVLTRLTLAFELDALSLVSEPVEIALDRVRIDANIYDPLGDRLVMASVSAQAIFGKTIALQAAGTYPDQRFSFSLAAPPGGGSLTLASVLALLGGPVDWVATEAPFNLQLTDLALEWDGQTGVATASVALAMSWGVGPFTLTDLAIQARRIHGTLDLGLSASVLVGDSLLFRAAAQRDAGVWSFTGQAAGTLDIGSALSQIARHFSVQVGVPQALANMDLVLRALSLSFSDGKGDETVGFALEMTATIDGRALDLTLKVAIPATQAHENRHGKRQASYGGTILIGSTKFALHFESNGDSNASDSMLVATLQAADGLALQDMLDALPGPKVHVPFSLAVQTAFVLTGGAKGHSRTLVGMRLADTIELGLLPVAGSALAGSEFRALTLVYSSAAFTKDELAALATTWSGAVEPLQDLQSAAQDLPPGVGFAATLQLSDHTIPFLLPRPLILPPKVGLQAVAAPAGPSANVAWRDVGKSFGPVRLDRVGAGYQNGAVWLLLDASLVLGPLELDLEGLGLGFDLHAFKAPDVTLSRMGLALDSGDALTIDGQFMHAGDDYIGQARVEAATLSLTATGGYTPGRDGPGPSVLLFARLDDPLGGPPYAYVTGVSLGFGVNRALVIPPLDGLPAFPLWPSSTAPAIPATTPPDATPASILGGVAGRLAAVAPRAMGESWLAAGVDFTSFGMVHSSALVSVAFGNRLEFALLGISHIRVPQEAEHPILFAEIALEARCAPDSGVLTVDGKLTAASYVFMPDCHLTGGFAFYLWFAGDHAGDFVVTLGGYHPRFAAPGRPAHYPDVPRLGLSYRSGHLSIAGSQYFALTPSMLMAGMQMQATWDSGPISAWFDAGMDFMLGWQPFHYEGHAYIHLGASFTVDLLFCSFTMTIHLGVDLYAWGPALGGRADIDLDIVSFSFLFGADPPPLPALDWTKFRRTLLPNPPKVQSAIRAMADATDVDPGLCTVSVAQGLRGSPGSVRPVNPAWFLKDGTPFAFQLDPNGFRLDCRSHLASTACPQLAGSAHATQLGLLPMGNKPGDFKATLEVTLSACNGQDHTDPASYTPFETLPLKAEAILESAHAALYGATASTLQTPPLIAHALMGVRLSPQTHSPELSHIAHLYDVLFDQAAAPLQRKLSLPLAPKPVHTAPKYADGDTLDVVFADGTTSQCHGRRLSVLTGSPAWVLDRRKALIAALHDMALLPDEGAPVLDGLAATALWDWPSLRALGEEVAA